jgi:hypothetical protein
MLPLTFLNEVLLNVSEGNFFVSNQLSRKSLSRISTSVLIEFMSAVISIIASLKSPLVETKVASNVLKIPSM